MAGKRAATEKFIIDNVESLLPGGGNAEIYKGLFKSMNDEQFDKFMENLADGSVKLSIIAPNLSSKKLTMENNYAVADRLGHNFFERVWMDGKNGAPRYLSKEPYMIIDLPMRRQAQLLIKKISIPEHNRSVDNLTGQPTGASKGSKISYPELNILAALKLDKSIIELIKFRGGDVQGFNAMNDAISRTGGVSQEAISSLGTTVKATQALSTYLLAMHLQNTLLNQ